MSPKRPYFCQPQSEENPDPIKRTTQDSSTIYHKIRSYDLPRPLPRSHQPISALDGVSESEAELTNQQQDPDMLIML